MSSEPEEQEHLTYSFLVYPSLPHPPNGVINTTRVSDITIPLGGLEQIPLGGLVQESALSLSVTRSQVALSIFPERGIRFAFI